MHNIQASYSKTHFFRLK